MAHAGTGSGETTKLLLDFNHPPGAVIEGRRIYLRLLLAELPQDSNDFIAVSTAGG
jgi:hypothetical protein